MIRKLHNIFVDHYLLLSESGVHLLNNNPPMITIYFCLFLYPSFHTYIWGYIFIFWNIIYLLLFRPPPPPKTTTTTITIIMSWHWKLYHAYSEKKKTNNGKNRIVKSRKKQNVQRKCNILKYWNRTPSNKWKWKKKIQKVYLRRTQKLETKPCNRILSKGINIYAVPIVR